jgi:hypothetical protein
VDPLILAFILTFATGFFVGALGWLLWMTDDTEYTPWVPPDGMARCGIRGCDNPHPATPWTEERDR